jgi:exonuclease III
LHEEKISARDLACLSDSAYEQALPNAFVQALPCICIHVTSVYLPNGNPQPGPKFQYKLAWFERLIAHARDLMASGAPVVLAGDYNVVPTPRTSIQLDH